MLWLLLLALNGGPFDHYYPVTICTRALDAVAGCQQSPGLGAMRSNACEQLSSWLCSMGTSPWTVP